MKYVDVDNDGQLTSKDASYNFYKRLWIQHFFNAK